MFTDARQPAQLFAHATILLSPGGSIAGNTNCATQDNIGPPKRLEPQLQYGFLISHKPKSSEEWKEIKNILEINLD